jgi:nicotinate-nucleotide adenylyltransferase
VARVGILGGTFNPPHIAHLVCAEEARAQLGLDQVLLMPVGQPPHKDTPDDPGAPHRLAMCRLAAQGSDWLEVSELELIRPGPSYTVDTLHELHASQPGDELTFIVGGDMAWSLPSWRDPESILATARLAVAERAGVRRDDLLAQLAPLNGEGRVDFVEMPRLDISSSEVRQRVRTGRPIRFLVPEEVADYIEERRLYV